MRPGTWLSLVFLLACDSTPTPRPSASAAAPPKAATVTSAAAPARASAKEAPPACVDRSPSGREAPPPGPDPRCPEDTGKRFDLRWGKVRFPASKAEVSVELAVEAPARQRGLMFRKDLPEEEGMLFVFERQRPLSFWMKNTCLPLDMLFIDEGGVIVGIEDNVPTLNQRSYRVRCPAKYVLEVNAGWAARHGVEPGQRVTFEGVAP